VVNEIERTAYEARAATDIAGIITLAELPSSVAVTLNSGATATLPITWATGVSHNPQGTVYNFTGNVTGNTNIIAPGGVFASVTVTITPTTPPLPTFDPIAILQGTEPTTAQLPTSGHVMIGSESVAYFIEWDAVDTSSLGNVAATGTASFPGIQAWLTLPSNFAVSRILEVSDLIPRTLTLSNALTTRAFSAGAFTVTASPSAAGGAITFTSSDTAVASVSNAGVVTLVGVGSTTITANVAETASHTAATASFVLTVTIGEQAAPAGLIAHRPTAQGASDGRITGVSNLMEYSSDDGVTWTAIAGSEITGLAAGTFLVRFTARTNFNTGAAATVTVLPWVATTQPPITDNGGHDTYEPTTPPTTQPTAPTDPTQPTDPSPPVVEIHIREEELLAMLEDDEDWVIEEDDITLLIPNELLEYLAAMLGEGEGDLNISVAVELPTEIDEGDEDAVIIEGALVTVNVNITIGEETIDELPEALTVSVSLEDIMNGLEVEFDLENINTYRLVAFDEQGKLIGGRFDPETGLLTFNAQGSGNFTIAYVESLTRLTIHINALEIIDLADNTPDVHMDQAPIIVDGRTLVPVRFLAYALGAEVDWTNAAWDGDVQTHPLVAHISLNGQTIDIPIGMITDELASLGMDVAAWLTGHRTMVPLRFISEFFGAVVTWDGETQTIEVIK